MAIIKAILPYFGGKRTLAPVIVQELGPHAGYYEPFCGSLPVLFNKPISSAETINDLYGDVVNLARQVQSERGPELWERTQRTLMCKPTFLDSCAELKKEFEPTFDRAFHFIVACWQGLNGLTGAKRAQPVFNLRYAPSGGSAAVRWQSVCESIPWWWERLQNVTILQQCGIDLCEKIQDRDDVVIYCDPPYFVKSTPYMHDFVDADHERLAAALCSKKRARVVVSYYQHEQLERLYPGWTLVDCTTRKSIATIGSKAGVDGDHVAPEVLLINGPSLTAPKDVQLELGA